MLRLKTKSMLRRRGALSTRLNRGHDKRDPRSILRSAAASHRHFYHHCAAAWRLVAFTERQEMRS